MSEKIAPGKMTLWFLGAQEPALERTIFEYDPELGEIVSMRGRSSGAFYNGSNFQWSPAVRALTVLLLRTAHAANQEPPSLSGEEGSLATSLDYAISKNPVWLSDMFGATETGAPYSKRLLQRSNSERRRPGPVTISVNNQVLRGEDLRVFLDGVEVVRREDLLLLAERIEGHSLVRKTQVSDSAKVVSIAKKFSGENSLDSREFSLGESKPSDGYAKYHYFTSSLDLEREYLRCLRSRVVDRKFGFLGRQSSGSWVELVRSEAYQYFYDSLKLVNASAEQIVRRIGAPARVISVWPGTGEKEVAIARAIATKYPCDLFFVDTSVEMMSLASECAKRQDLLVECYVADFMRPGILAAVNERVRQNGCLNVLTFFGHTLGTYPQAEILQTIRAAIVKQDFVIFGLHTREEIAAETSGDIIASFETQYSNQYFKSQVMGALQLGGISPEMGEIEIEFHQDRFFPELKVVEQYFRFNRSTVIHYAGEACPFSEGERLMMTSFYQYSREVAFRILQSQGFEIVDSFSDAGGALEILCRKV